MFVGVIFKLSICDLEESVTSKISFEDLLSHPLIYADIYEMVLLYVESFVLEASFELVSGRMGKILTEMSRK